MDVHRLFTSYASRASPSFCSEPPPEHCRHGMFTVGGVRSGEGQRGFYAMLPDHRDHKSAAWEKREDSTRGPRAPSLFSHHWSSRHLVPGPRNMARCASGRYAQRIEAMFNAELEMDVVRAARWFIGWRVASHISACRNGHNRHIGMRAVHLVGRCQRHFLMTCQVGAPQFLCKRAPCCHGCAVVVGLHSS